MRFGERYQTGSRYSVRADLIAPDAILQFGGAILEEHCAKPAAPYFKVEIEAVVFDRAVGGACGDKYAVLEDERLAVDIALVAQLLIAERELIAAQLTAGHIGERSTLGVGEVGGAAEIH